MNFWSFLIQFFLILGGGGDDPSNHDEEETETLIEPQIQSPEDEEKTVDEKNTPKMTSRSSKTPFILDPSDRISLNTGEKLNNFDKMEA